MLKVGLFFVVNHQVLVDGVDLDQAEIYGDFRIGSTSHWEVWQKAYISLYRVPYDYYPRGRVVYHCPTGQLILYADRCLIGEDLARVKEAFGIGADQACRSQTDAHYVCRSCGRGQYEL